MRSTFDQAGTIPRRHVSGSIEKRCFSQSLVHCSLTKNRRVMLNAALECWTLNADIFQPELARTTWVKAKLLQELGESLKASLAFKVVGRLRAKLVPDDRRDVRDLKDEDFDCLVGYRSR